MLFILRILFIAQQWDLIGTDGQIRRPQLLDLHSSGLPLSIAVLWVFLALGKTGIPLVCGVIRFDIAPGEGIEACGKDQLCLTCSIYSILDRKLPCPGVQKDVYVVDESHFYVSLFSPLTLVGEKREAIITCIRPGAGRVCVEPPPP